MIKEAKIFKNGQSQAVRLPKEYRFDSKSVYINRVGPYVLLIPRDDPWAGLRESLDNFSDDFMHDRDQGAIDFREDFEA